VYIDSEMKRVCRNAGRTMYLEQNEVVDIVEFWGKEGVGVL